MKQITVPELFELAYGKKSTLKNHRTWWGAPRYTAGKIQEILAGIDGFQATRYPSGRIQHLRGPSLSRTELEALILG